MYNDRQNRGNALGGRGAAPGQQLPVKISPKSLPEDYVSRAEDAIRAIKEAGNADRRAKAISTSKLRSLFSLFTQTYDQVIRSDQQKLNDEQKGTLDAARVRIYYEIGRDDGYRYAIDTGAVGRFVKGTDMLEYLMDIGDSCEKLIAFYHYMEALVAFHRYYFDDKSDRN